MPDKIQTSASDAFRIAALTGAIGAIVLFVCIGREEQRVTG
jgi:uncharacterized membrane protein